MAALDFPDTPTVGQLYGSSGTQWRWSGTRWESTTGPSGPRGVVSYANVVVNQGSIGSTPLGLTGMIVTWTADPSRTYRTTAFNMFTGDVTGMVVEMRIVNAGGTKIQSSSNLGVRPVYGSPIYAQIIESGLSGTQTRSVQASTGLAGQTAATVPNSGNPAFISVEDITYEAGSAGTQAGTRLPIQVYSVPVYDMNPSASAGTLLTMSIPSATAQRIIDVTYLAIITVLTGLPRLQIRLNNAIAVQHQIYGQSQIHLRTVLLLPPNQVHTITLWWDGGGTATFPGDSTFQQFYANAQQYP